MFNQQSPFHLVGTFNPFGLAQADSTGTVIATGTYNTNYASWNTLDPTLVIQAQKTVAMPAQLKASLSTVFQGVKLYVDPLPLLVASSPQAMQGYIAQILVAVDDLTSSGLKVIVDFEVQPSPSTIAGWGSSDIIDGPTGPKFTALIAAGVAMVTALLPYGDNVAFELYGSPGPSSLFVSPVNPWPTQLLAYWTAVRAAAPNMTLIVSAADAGLPATLISTINPQLFDLKTAFAFQLFIPEVFAQQNTLLWGNYYYVHGLPFPPNLNTDSISVETSKMISAAGQANDLLTEDQRAALIAQISTDIKSYFNVPEDNTWIAAQFAQVSAWAASKNGLPAYNLFLSQWGSPGNVTLPGSPQTVGADDQSRTNYIKAVRAAASAIGISTSCHILSDPTGGYSLTDSNQEFIPELIWAFGGSV